MFNAIKEFFFGKPAAAPAPAVVEAANQAPYKVPEPVAPVPVSPVVEAAPAPVPAKAPAKITANNKKPAASKKPAGAKKAPAKRAPKK